jgi:formate-dependent nitrite reductase cytochrome c552 subunit
MSFFTCSEAGCHNYHDNRGLWEDYLKKHIGEPENLASMKVIPRGVVHVATTAKSLKVKDQDAPRTVAVSQAMIDDWEDSAHARASINCTGCHGGLSTPWENRPSLAVCGSCHAKEDKGFREGRHGMRASVGLSAMSPSAARLPMKPEAKTRELGCHSCHGTHKYDAKVAAVDSCLGCHDDEHSKNYTRSPHFKLWEAELAGKAEAGTGVSCATCHMPREKMAQDDVWVQHNQNDNLRPNEKMMRNVCTSCHGVSFSLDAMADEELVRQNFDGRPKKHVTTVDMVEKRVSAKRK